MPEQNADLLRRAAAKLREHAEAAPAGPWVSLDNGDRLVALREDASLFPAGFRYLVDEPIDDSAIAAYFALMHPPVALAIADWLDLTASFLNFAGGAGLPVPRTAKAATTVARAVLREPEDGTP